MDRAIAASTTTIGSEDASIEGIRAQRAWILFRLGRRSEALDAVTRAVAALEQMKDPNDGHAMALSRVLRARMLGRTGRLDQAESSARAALEWFERWGRDHPAYADAECELGRAQVLQGAIPNGRAALERCLPIYRAWGLADREVVGSLERLLAQSAH